MRTKTISKPILTAKPRVNVVTLGCSKNIYDSEVLMGQLKGNAWDVVHRPKSFVTTISSLSIPAALLITPSRNLSIPYCNTVN
jgi:hypothetical protein